MANVRPFPDFDACVHAVLAYLQRRLGFDLWLLSRTVGDQSVVLSSQDASYGIRDDRTLRWIATYCTRMVLGSAPNMRTRAADFQTFIRPPGAEALPIGAYVGIPLKRADGSPFGTLCAINPRPMPEIVSTDMPLVELFGRLLTTLLEQELAAQEQARRADLAEMEALVDALTGLYNRRGWDQFLAREEHRCARYGHPACVVVIDLDNLKIVNDSLGHAAGDELLRRTGRALQSTVREHDVVARVGGDEFAVLGVECDLGKAESLVNRLSRALEDEQIEASIGVSLRASNKQLAQTWEQADAAMYISKNAGRQLRDNAQPNP